MTLTIIFVIFILAFTIRAWLPIISNRQLSLKYWIAILALTFSSLLQIVFNVCVGTGRLPLDYSLRFAAVGSPCCLIALVLASIDSKKVDTSKGVVVGAILGLLMWYVFITLH